MYCTRTEHSRRQLFDNFFGLTEFGNWCGPGHGGTNDCCDDEPCSQCNDTVGTSAPRLPLPMSSRSRALSDSRHVPA
jgi:hypothetical protein